MNIIHQVTILILLVASWPLYSDQTHCKTNEKILINCSIKSSEKILSLCGNGAELEYGKDDIEAEIQYRFGRTNDIELVFPKIMSGSAKSFKQHRDSHGWMGLSLYEVSFSISGNKYAIFRHESNTKYSEIDKNADIVGGDEKTGFQQRTVGIWVDPSSGGDVKLLCDTQKPNFKMNLFELLSVLEEAY